MDANATTLVQFSIKSYRNCSDRANRIQWNTMIQWWLDQARARYYLFLLFEYPGLARRPLLLFSERSITPSTVNIVLMKWRETASKYCSAWRVTPRETSLQLSLSWRTSKRVSSFTWDAALTQRSLEVEDGHIGEGQPGGLPLHRGGGTSANFILESVQRLIGFSTVFRMDLVDSCTRWQLWMSVIQDTGSSISTNLPNLISFFVFLLCVWLCVLFDHNLTACSTRLPYKQDISRGFGWKADRNKISVVRFVWSNPSQTEGQLTEPHQWQGPASYCHPHSLTDWDALCSTRCTYYNTIILLSNGQAKHLRSLAIQNIWYQLISLINGLT